MTGKALGTNNEAGTKLILANNKIVGGTHSKIEFVNDYDYRGDKKVETTFSGDNHSTKTFHHTDGEDDKSPLFLARHEDHKKGKKITEKEFNADGSVKIEKHWNGKGELFAQAEANGKQTDFSCISKPNYQDKKNFYKHCVDEDYSSPITKVFKKLEEKYPEMEKVQNRLNTTFKIRYDAKAKCIVKSATSKVTVKFNPDKEYVQSEYNYTVDKKYELSSKDDDEIYTVLTSGKNLRESCSTIAQEPRSKSMGQYGKLKKAVYCKEAPKNDEDNIAN